MRKALSIILGMAALAATPASAGDRMGVQALATGNYAAAERALIAERRIYPGRPELMLNLAAVYRHTGRTAAAQSLYADAMTAPDVMLALPNGETASSRQLAKDGLEHLSAVETASR